MIPNFHRVLDREKIDFLQFTAGRYKRTVTPVTEATDEAKAKLQSELEEIHGAFKDLVARTADSDIEDVATGEAWIASLAPPGVVDDLMTSGEPCGRRWRPRTSCSSSRASGRGRSSRRSTPPSSAASASRRPRPPTSASTPPPRPN
ncbi:peptidase [Aureococcus anophagefferens]|nr:peptidase [Aureococcus anophagefferens]